VQKILVSACLLGERVRHDGRAAQVTSGHLERWSREGRLVRVCPELAGGLSVPRPPAEIVAGEGEAVLQGRASVQTRAGADLTAAYLQGAQAALALALEHGAGMAILKSRSPSCGSRQVYDGSFTGVLREGEGVTAALLRAHGLAVFDEERLEAAAAHLDSLGDQT